MKKRIAAALCMAFLLFCHGCGANTEELQDTASDEKTQSVESSQFLEDSYMEGADNGANYNGADDSDAGDNGADNSSVDDSDADDSSAGDIEEKGEGVSIQDEIAAIESKSCEYENADWDSMGQQDMNQVTAQWYQLWDDELNSLWSRLSDEWDAETKAEALEEQRAWIERKEKNIRGAGASAFGGSLQPQLENTTAEEMTRARVYVLAGYLADVRNESFMIPPEIQESIDKAEPNLNDVFQKFEGQWIFDEERGACVGVERSETCAYGVTGSNWTVWVTGGDIISDLDVYGYTENSILFRVWHEGYDAFFELSFDFNQTHAIYFAYGTSLDAMDEVIVCD